ncbi:MAG: hypothetical protein KC776_03095 [Myxococcales bacterium]|nr:hypothetical protein [Myxococcales bacterium]
MRSGLTLLALAVAAAASGCKKDDPTPRPVGAPTATPTPPPATPPPTATATATALPTAGRWDCVKDLDCTNSCEYGAVNRAWYTKNVPNEPCEDGCDGPWSDNPQCIDGGCVAFQNGKRAPSCTRRLRE